MHASSTTQNKEKDFVTKDREKEIFWRWNAKYLYRQIRPLLLVDQFTLVCSCLFLRAVYLPPQPLMFLNFQNFDQECTNKLYIHGFFKHRIAFSSTLNDFMRLETIFKNMHAICWSSRLLTQRSWRNNRRDTKK
jgi:hypothetical protein